MVSTWVLQLASLLHVFGFVVEGSYYNGPCGGGGEGVCVTIAECKSYNWGTQTAVSIPNECPGTPDDVECCYVSYCNGVSGYCNWDYQCTDGYDTPGEDALLPACKSMVAHTLTLYACRRMSRAKPVPVLRLRRLSDWTPWWQAFVLRCKSCE